MAQESMDKVIDVYILGTKSSDFRLAGRPGLGIVREDARFGQTQCLATAKHTITAFGIHGKDEVDLRALSNCAYAWLG